MSSKKSNNICSLIYLVFYLALFLLTIYMIIQSIYITGMYSDIVFIEILLTLFQSIQLIISTHFVDYTIFLEINTNIQELHDIKTSPKRIKELYDTTSTMRLSYIILYIESLLNLVLLGLACAYTYVGIVDYDIKHWYYAIFILLIVICVVWILKFVNKINNFHYKIKKEIGNVSKEK